MNSNFKWLLFLLFLISFLLQTKTSSVNYFPCPSENRFNSCKIDDIIIHPCSQGLLDHHCNLFPFQPTVLVVIWTSPLKCKKATWNLFVQLSNGYQSIINDTNACHHTKCPFDGKRRMLIYEFQIPAYFKSGLYEFMMVVKSRKGNHACCARFQANVVNDDNKSAISKKSKEQLDDYEFWKNFAVLFISSVLEKSTNLNASVTSSFKNL